MPTDQATLPLQAPDSTKKRFGHYRWVICALLFFGTTVNYVDRQVLSFIAPDVQRAYHIDDKQFGKIIGAFTLCYAAGQLFAGNWLDRVGNRIGYSLAITAWSIASMLHAVASSALGFGIARGLLGISESPNYPAATKALAEWLPRRERALGMGIVNGGSNLGALLVPIVVPVIVIKWGLRAAFVVTGAAGMLFVLMWIPLYRRPQEHPRVSQAELEHILSDPLEPPGKIRWLSLLAYPQAWAFVASKFITDANWSFLIFFSTKFLNKQFNLDIKHVGPPMIAIWLLADVGSIFGGWISGRLLKRGWTLNAARKLTLGVSALFVTPVVLAAYVHNMWTATVLIGLAMAAHQAFSANQYTLVSDLFPRRAVGSVAGMGGSAGYFGATILSVLTGYILFWSGGNYSVPFLIVGCGYLVAFAIIQLCTPRLEPAQLDDSPPSGFPVILTPKM
jgi:ACS family hexuronate transporter-like MFS transporter